MYNGRTTSELEWLKVQYEEMFGYAPDGEMELEFGDDYETYLFVLQHSVQEKKDMFEIIERYNL